ncbi:MAG TPA: P1 family peptidase [Pseudomonadota bacterium]|nr:P1 family peptidase [Pseudomonadota bacterium]
MTSWKRPAHLFRSNGIPFFLFLGFVTGSLPTVHADRKDERSPLEQVKPRARNLGIPFEGTPGPWNAITDVPGVTVGHVTLHSGTGPLVTGKGPIRTGVTAILPRGQQARPRSVAAVVCQNGNGELTGSHWVNESGLLESPILLTNTDSVGVVRDAVIAWGNRHFPPAPDQEEVFALPVVAETSDAFLNDIAGQHVKPEHVFRALDSAKTGPVAEGNVGGGTGMMTSEWKGGIGTSSRKITLPSGTYTVGVLVQANYGRRGDLRISGVPVGQEIPELMPLFPKVQNPEKRRDGSIIVVLATDVPLLPHQMTRLTRRVAMGLGRNGAVSYNSSGDIFIGFGTSEPQVSATGMQTWQAIANEATDKVFQAAVRATEEAVVNALVAAETMVGANGVTVYALPHDKLRAVLRKYGRLEER